MKNAVRKYPLKNNTTTNKKLDDMPFRVAGITKTGYSVYIGYELSTLESMKTRLLQIFVAVFPFAILLSILCGYFVTQQSLNAINTISKTAGRISLKNLGERIKVPAGKDEITQLIITLRLI